MKRLATIDTVRGLVMVIMALDHVRDLLHSPALTQDPTNLSTTTAPVFLTRLITHLCAPTFVFLAGTSVYLSTHKAGKPTGEALTERSRFLLKRGLVLILLELTLINFAFWTDLQFRTMMLQVIFVIGVGLVLLSWLIRFQVRTLLIVGIAIICLHDLLLLVPTFASPAARLGWALLFRSDFLPISPQFGLLVAYSIVPWFGIMLAGYGCGPLFSKSLADRKAQLVKLGLGSLLLFAVLRFINVYGDAAPWSVQKSTLFTTLSFLNVSKYPPSLLYAALMLGVMFLLLALWDGADNWLTRRLRVYGKVPLFYYLIHWYLVKGAMIGMVLMQGYAISDMPIGTLSFGRPAGAGVTLPVVYAVWLGLVIALYPICAWYGRYKAGHPDVAWTRYI
ncbi:DUF1624 domain-containing protein [Fibrivirga algicola]|uniref:DUF1624 domain-containing protein n=1 Tax=Fibrivirga algicola TaxID=2950420 RepID=A0ABX0QBI5_9BACT|nr:heparan-alpha-glucosaminide N-acetyltransferase domain-containing protein [Fibrivirga algicola]NID09716.1 DUF1624 domain-containing protein [Fibrivirga algicola]